MHLKPSSSLSFSFPFALLLVLTSGCNSSISRVTPQAVTESMPTNIPVFWTPEPLSSFQIQFSEEIDLAADAQLVELDMFDTVASTISLLHEKGKKVICYINAGATEDWRPDVVQFPLEVVGNIYAGWPGENWLDIRRRDALAPILEARIDLCQSKGFDGVEFDNLDGYQNDTGFDLTAKDQLAFNRWLAEAAHARGLIVGLKNDPEQISELEPWFDYLLLESCFEWDWCNLSAPFAASGKAIFDIEYSSISSHCEEAKALSITLIGKNRELDGELHTCP